MANQSNPTQAMHALQMLLEDQPDRMEVRLVLAQVQMNGKLPKDAIETLIPVKKVTPPATRPSSNLRFWRLPEWKWATCRRRDSYAQRWLENACKG